ncbi:MAG: hypothetical protein K0U29_07200 [Gammaproteobacteria bacterium]|nr:hypothetical protein [Gammaproteobacteria bacterium]MCH9744698.1 hypothetical protein [Gammaproteobacteria bacterium]
MKTTIKNKTILATTLIGALFATSCSYAGNLFLSKGLMGTAEGPAIVTATIITPGNKEINLDKAAVYIGTSNTAPCSDLHSAFSANGGEVDPGVKPASSDELYQTFGNSYTVTCFKEDMTYNGKAYSTGNIKLTHNSGDTAYTSASPSHVTLDFTK